MLTNSIRKLSSIPFLVFSSLCLPLVLIHIFYIHILKLLRCWYMSKVRPLPVRSTISLKDALYRVGRVVSFFSSRRNWDSPNPSPAGECEPPPPFGSGGRGTFAGERRVGRVPIPTRGLTLWYSLYLCTLWCTATLASCSKPHCKPIGPLSGPLTQHPYLLRIEVSARPFRFFHHYYFIPAFSPWLITSQFNLSSIFQNPLPLSLVGGVMCEMIACVRLFVCE